MKKSCFFILMFCLLLSGCSKEEVLEKYNAVVEKVGEVQLTVNGRIRVPFYSLQVMP